MTKKNAVNVLYDIDKSSCFKSEIGPQDQQMMIEMEDLPGTELDEVSLRFIIDVARCSKTTPKQLV